MQDPAYRVVIESTLEAGSLTYGELHIPGELTTKYSYQRIAVILVLPMTISRELSLPLRWPNMSAAEAGI